MVCQCCEDGADDTRRFRTPRSALLGDAPPIGMSVDKTATTKRDNYIDWHDYFMSVAVLSAYRSKDPSRQVGACVIEPSTNRIVGIGYNGFPQGCSDSSLPWAVRPPRLRATRRPAPAAGL